MNVRSDKFAFEVTIERLDSEVQILKKQVTDLNDRFFSAPVAEETETLAQDSGEQLFGPQARTARFLALHAPDTTSRDLAQAVLRLRAQLKEAQQLEADTRTRNVELEQKLERAHDALDVLHGQKILADAKFTAMDRDLAEIVAVFNAAKLEETAQNIAERQAIRAYNTEGEQNG